MKISSTVRKGEFGKVPRIRQLAGFLPYAEIELSVLTKQCLSRRLSDEWTLNLELIAWENAANTSHRQIHWSFTVEDARHVFAHYYPSSLPS